MDDQFARTRLLIGSPAIRCLQKSRVAVFGIGGVGGYAVEALARSGVGALDLIDNDKVVLSNLNRQIIAVHSTVGQYKTDIARNRILDINPEIQVAVHRTFYLPETASQFDFKQYDYIVDAIDTVSGKLELITQANKAGTPIISCMGTGNKLDPTKLQVSDLSKTSMCPLARVMRRECHKRGIDHVKVVYSQEPARTPMDDSGNPMMPSDDSGRRSVPGSIAFVPSVAGLILAGEVIKDLIGLNT